MGDDPLARRLSDLETARLALVRELEALGQAVELNRELRRRGTTVTDIFRQSPGPATRRRVRQALNRLNEALHAYRAEAVRCLVEEEGLSIAEVARRTGNARQVISRLYQAARRD